MSPTFLNSSVLFLFIFQSCCRLDSRWGSCKGVGWQRRDCYVYSENVPRLPHLRGHNCCQRQWIAIQYVTGRLYGMSMQIVQVIKKNVDFLVFVLNVIKSDWKGESVETFCIVYLRTIDEVNIQKILTLSLNLYQVNSW